VRPRFYSRDMIGFPPKKQGGWNSWRDDGKLKRTPLPSKYI